MFNYQQYMSAIRWGMTLAGGALATKFGIDGGVWTAVTSLVLAGAPFIWSMIRHTKVGTLLAADDLPEVAGVIMRTTSDGVALAKATPKETVTTAGTVVASSIARAA